MITESLERNAESYRSLGDIYAGIAASTDYLPRKRANSAEAAKYYAMADASHAAGQACGSASNDD